LTMPKSPARQSAAMALTAACSWAVNPAVLCNVDRK